MCLDLCSDAILTRDVEEHGLRAGGVGTSWSDTVCLLSPKKSTRSSSST
jgi:hypothetical protein